MDHSYSRLLSYLRPSTNLLDRHCFSIVSRGGYRSGALKIAQPKFSRASSSSKSLAPHPSQNPVAAPVVSTRRLYFESYLLRNNNNGIMLRNKFPKVRWTSYRYITYCWNPMTWHPAGNFNERVSEWVRVTYRCASHWKSLYKSLCNIYTYNCSCFLIVKFLILLVA